MLDTFGILTIGGALAAVLAAVVCSLSMPVATRVVLAAAGGLWTGVVVAVTIGNANGLLVLFPVPLVATALLAAFVPRFRAALMDISPPLIIGLNVVRVIGVSFLLLAAAGRLSGPFPYFAGIGDIITGLFALPAASLAQRSGVRNARVLAWNAFGLLDLVVAATLGVASSPGRLEVIYAGVGSAAIRTLPWSLIVFGLVPWFFIGHILVFAHARTERRQRAPLA